MVNLWVADANMHISFIYIYRSCNVNNIGIARSMIVTAKSKIYYELIIQV